MKTHYICQTRHGNWMIGTKVNNPPELGNGVSICGGSCVEEPFASIYCNDGSAGKTITAYELKVIDNKLTRVPMGSVIMDGKSTTFPTKKLLIEALNKIGYSQGKKHGYHCWEIIKS